jgi:ribosomal protein L40E
MPAERKEGMPLFDSLLEIVGAVKNKTAPQSELENRLISFEAMIQNARQEIQREALPELAQEVEQIESSLLLFEKGVDQIKKYLENGKESCLNSGVEEIQHSLQEMKTGAIKFARKKNGLKPSREQSFNLMFNYFQFFQEGKCPEETFQEMAQLHETHFTKMEHAVRRLNKNQNLRHELLQKLDELNQNLPAAKEALQQFMLSASQKSYPGLADKLHALHLYWDLYHDFLGKKAELDQKIELQGKICPRCQTQNHFLAQNCKTCSFIFPQIEPSAIHFDLSEESAKNPLFDEIFETLENAVEDYADSLITRDSFCSTLDWINEKVNLFRGKLQAVPQLSEQPVTSDPELEEELKRIFMLAMDKYSKGLEEAENGLSLLYQWADSGLQHDCSTGMEIFSEGAEKIQEATSLVKTRLTPNLPKGFS